MLSDRKSVNIESKEYPFQAPVVCYEDQKIGKLIITQGIHRATLCMRENRYINFVITDHIMPASQAQLSKEQDWNINDYVYSYSKQGNENYIILYTLWKENPKYSIVTLGVMITGKIMSTKNIEEGYFIIEGEVNKAKEIARERINVDLRIICPQKTQFFAKVNHLINIKGVIQCENYVSHWITPLIILNITIK